VRPPLLGELELGERVAARRNGFRCDEEDEEIALLDRGADPRVEGLARRQRRAVAKHSVAFSLERQLDARGRLFKRGWVRKKDCALHRAGSLAIDAPPPHYFLAAMCATTGALPCVVIGFVAG
jgi:hypothetical protein